MEELALKYPLGYEVIYRYDYANKVFGVIGSAGQESSCYYLDWEDWESMIKKDGVRKDER